MLVYVHVSMDNRRYITRYNGEKGTRKSFCGWRLCITRRKVVFVRYFTDREYGSPEAALKAALERRDTMLKEMEDGAKSSVVFRRYRKK